MKLDIASIGTPPAPFAGARIVKHCDCGAGYTKECWADLPYLGRLQAFGDMAAIELRNCVCGSTIAVKVDDGPPVGAS